MTNHLLSIYDEITWETVGQVIDGTYHKYREEPFDCLIVILSSQGGDLDAGWALYAAIKHLGCKVVTVANGRLYSAGVLAYLAGDHRFVYDDSIFLFHPTTILVNDEERASFKSEDEVLDFKMDDKLFNELLKKTLTKATKKDINSLTHKYKSRFVKADEAVRIGLADQIIDKFTQIPGIIEEMNVPIQ